MADGQLTVRVHGLDELRGKLHGSRVDAPVGRFLDRGATYLQGKAREHVTVDTGRLRNSIGVESPTLRMRRVGPNAIGPGGRNYGADVEFGTKPHWPPPGALAGWAKRKGLDEGAIRHKISIAGTRAQPYMQPAADETSGYIPSLIPTLAAEIESAYQ